MEESIALDPVEFCPERAELSLHELGLEVRAEGADWGESEIQTQMARQSIGAFVTDRHLEPVEMSIPLMVKAEGEVSLAEAAQKIQQKLGLYQQESGGWARRDFATAGGFAGSVGYQVLKASMPGLQGWLFAHREIASEVSLKLLRSPLCYATVEAESDIFKSEEGARELIFELAEVLGTAPGLIRIRITNEGEEDWRALILAGESRDHPQDETADTTAALAYDAVDLTLKGGAEEAEREGEKVVRHEGLTAGWLTILDSEITAEELGHWTHKGVRRPWMRIWDPGSEPGDVQLHARWRALGSLQWSDENPVVPTPLVDNWAPVDLGEARPESAALGDERWELQVQARAVSGSGAIDLQRIYPLPTEQFVVVRAPGAVVAADVQITKSPGTVEDKEGVGTVAWTNPSNAKASDDSPATAKVEENAVSHYLKATNFGFGLPEDATVLGIIAGVERSRAKGGPESVFDSRVRIVKGGNVGSIDKASPDGWPASDAIHFYGNASDLWGEKWAPTDINDSSFGVALAARGSHDGGTARVDHIAITVYYTEAADENRVCFAGRSIELRSDGVYRQHPEDDVWGMVIPEGFLPYASPSGLEGRKSRFIAIPSVGDLGELADSGPTKLSVQGLVRGAYHFAREAA